MRVAIRRAVSDEYLTNDPFSNVGEATENPEERGILTPAEVQNLIKAPIKNIQYRAVVLLGALCGMRRGEMRGLFWGDIQDSIINLNHNFVNYDGLKDPKRGSKRLVPLLKPVIKILEKLKELTPNPVPDSFVFASSKCPGNPLGETFFRNAFCRELEGIGIPGKWHSRKPCPEGYVNVQEERNLTLHGMRHDFVTLARLAGVTDMEIQALAGHKDARMMAQYSHAKQVIDFTETKKKLEKGFIGFAEKTEPETKAAGGNE
jgi:integrase